jgi:hypothetical protein
MKRRLFHPGVPLDVPIASPLASSHDRCLSLRAGAFARITPGSLAVCSVVLFRLGGWS